MEDSSKALRDEIDSEPLYLYIISDQVRYTNSTNPDLTTVVNLGHHKIIAFRGDLKASWIARKKIDLNDWETR